jgi:hypothetical protein
VVAQRRCEGVLSADGSTAGGCGGQGLVEEICQPPGEQAAKSAAHGRTSRTNGTELSATYVGAVDQSGDAIPGKRARVVFDVNGDVDDIIMEDI